MKKPLLYLSLFLLFAVPLAGIVEMKRTYMYRKLKSLGITPTLEKKTL